MAKKKDPVLNPGVKRNTGNRLKSNAAGIEKQLGPSATFDTTKPSAFADGATSLYNDGFRLEITHVPSDRTLWFGAFIEGFSDAYNSEWNAEQVYGRMDPISTFMNTRRAISVSWKIPAASVEEGVDNMNKVNELMAYLYPSYEGTSGGVATINMAPLWRVKFGNLISSANGHPQGLLGYVNGLTMDPIIEDGMFMFSPKAMGDSQDQDSRFTGSTRGPLRTNGMEYIPKTIRLNFEMTVLHEHPLGWTTTSNGAQRFRGGGRRGFPYASRGLGVRMPPALTNIQYGQNPTRKRKETPKEDRRKKTPKGQTGPGKSGTSTVTKPAQDGSDGPLGKVKEVTGKPLLNLNRDK
jgi:hypothetical protein